MNKQAIANTLKSLQKTMRKHSPAILTGIGIAGMAAAAVMAVRATPKALRMVDDGLNGEVECWIIDAPFPPVTYEEWEDMEI